MGTALPQKPGRRRNKQQPTLASANPNPLPDPSQQTTTRTPATNAGSKQLDAKGAGVKAVDKQKANRQQTPPSNNLVKPEEKAQQGSLAQTAPQPSQSTARGNTPAQLGGSGPTSGPTSSGVTKADSKSNSSGSGSLAPAAGNLQPVKNAQKGQGQGQGQSQQRQPQQAQQLRQGPSVQGLSGQQPRSAVSQSASNRPAAGVNRGTGIGTGRAVTNYSAAVSGLAQSTAALKLHQAEPAPRRTAAFAELQPQLQPPPPPPSTAAPQPGVTTSHQGALTFQTYLRPVLAFADMPSTLDDCFVVKLHINCTLLRCPLLMFSQVDCLPGNFCDASQRPCLWSLPTALVGHAPAFCPFLDESCHACLTSCTQQPRFAS